MATLQDFLSTYEQLNKTASSEENNQFDVASPEIDSKEASYEGDLQGYEDSEIARVYKEASDVLSDEEKQGLDIQAFEEALVRLKSAGLTEIEPDEDIIMVKAANMMEARSIEKDIELGDLFEELEPEESDLGAIQDVAMEKAASDTYHVINAMADSGYLEEVMPGLSSYVGEVLDERFS